jgi:hypothetical protein
VVLEVRTCQCQPDIGVTAEPGACDAVVAFDPPLFVDVADGTNLTVVCQPPSGASFPTGSTVVECTASDQQGNQARCGFSVVVSQNPADLLVLRVQREPSLPDRVIISWPVPCDSLIVLEQADVLGASAGWVLVTDPIELEGDHYRVVTSAASGSRFYRLRKP